MRVVVLVSKWRLGRRVKVKADKVMSNFQRQRVLLLVAVFNLFDNVCCQRSGGLPVGGSSSIAPIGLMEIGLLG